MFRPASSPTPSARADPPAACDVQQAKPATFEANNVSAETRSFTQQQADALVLVAETALHHGIDPGTPGARYQVVVHVDAGVLADAEAPFGHHPRPAKTTSSG